MADNLTDSADAGTTFQGHAFHDGFALRGQSDITLVGCKFYGDSPMWDVDGFSMDDCDVTRFAPSPIWNSSGGRILNTSIHAPKAMRDCQDMELDGVSVVSDSFGWGCSYMTLRQVWLHGDSPLYNARNVRMEGVVVIGGEALQHAENVEIDRAHIDTRNGLWQTKHVTISDSILQGNRLGWYSEDVTLVRCQVMGATPLCRCKGIRLVDCVVTDRAGAFDGSSVTEETA